MLKVQLAVLAVASALFGCTMIPRYERPAMPVAARFPEGTDTVERNSAELAWRNFFGDERLKRLIELALNNNRDLRVALLNVEQSRAQYRITRASSLPVVDGGGGFTRSRALGTTSDQWSANLNSSAYEVDLFGRVRSLNRQALEKYLATEEARRGTRISLIAEVATEYFTFRQVEEQLQLTRQTLAAVQASYDLNRAMFDAGATSELDLRTAEGQVLAVKINLLTYERQLAQAEDDLVLLVGQPLPADLPAPAAFDAADLVAKIPAGLPSELVARRPDILDAEHSLKAANASIGAARAAFFPSLTLTGSLGTTSPEFARLFGAGTGTWSFSPHLTVPIFAGDQNRANLDSAEVSKRIEVANYEKAIQVAFREVADALVAVRTYGDEIQERAKQVGAQQRRYALAIARYRQGDDTYLSALSAQQDLYSAQQGQLQAQSNQLASQISLYKALGGGWQ